MVIVGAVLSTVKVLLAVEAGAVLPAESLAVPAAIEMPTVLLPVMLVIVTVRGLPLLETSTVPLAVPLRLSVTPFVESVFVFRFASA